MMVNQSNNSQLIQYLVNSLLFAKFDAIRFTLPKNNTNPRLAQTTPVREYGDPKSNEQKRRIGCRPCQFAFPIPLLKCPRPPCQKGEEGIILS